MVRPTRTERATLRNCGSIPRTTPRRRPLPTGHPGRPPARRRRSPGEAPATRRERVPISVTLRSATLETQTDPPPTARSAGRTPTGTWARTSPSSGSRIASCSGEPPPRPRRPHRERGGGGGRDRDGRRRANTAGCRRRAAARRGRPSPGPPRSLQTLGETLDATRPRPRDGVRHRACSLSDRLVTSTWPPRARSITRAARFTAAPNTSPSPSTTSPVSSPIRTRMPSSCAARSRWIDSATPPRSGGLEHREEAVARRTHHAPADGRRPDRGRSGRARRRQPLQPGPLARRQLRRRLDIGEHHGRHGARARVTSPPRGHPPTARRPLQTRACDARHMAGAFLDALTEAEADDLHTVGRRAATARTRPDPVPRGRRARARWSASPPSGRRQGRLAQRSRARGDRRRPRAG